MSLERLPNLGSFALRVVGYLDDVWPFHVPEGGDKLAMAARAVAKIKKEKPETWDDLQHLPPKDAADVIVSLMLDDKNVYQRLKAARVARRHTERLATAVPKEKQVEDLANKAKSALAKLLSDNGFYPPSVDRQSSTSTVVYSWYAPARYLHLVVACGNLNARVQVKFEENVIMDEELPREKADALLKKGLQALKAKLTKAARERDAQNAQRANDEVWSVAHTGHGHGYVTEVDTFSSKSKAMQAAKDAGGAYVMRGTQMWNEPLGQIEESNRPASYQWVK